MMDYRGFPSLSHPHPLLSLPAILFSAKDDQDPVSLHFASFPRGRILVFSRFFFVSNPETTCAAVVEICGD